MKPKQQRATARQKRTNARRRESRRAAVKQVAAPTKPSSIRIEKVSLSHGWTLAVMHHNRRDPRVLGREPDAIAYVRGLAQPYTCGGCNSTPNALLAGVLDTPTMDQLGVRCVACRNGAGGLFSDLGLLATNAVLTDQVLKMVVQGIEQMQQADAEVMERDANWFNRNGGRRLRLRPPLNDVERGSSMPPMPGMQAVMCVRRDANPWITPDLFWVPQGGIRLDLEDSPAGFEDERLDALIEATMSMANKPMDPFELIRRAEAIYRSHKQAGVTVRAAARGAAGGAV